MSETALWEWIPLVSMGPICFGDPIELHMSTLELSERESDLDEGDRWTRYWSRDRTLSVLAINGRVTSVTTERCSYQGKTLIGTTDRELRQMFTDVHCELEDDPFGYSLAFASLGLDAHLRDDVVVAVTASVDPDAVL